MTFGNVSGTGKLKVPQHKVRFDTERKNPLASQKFMKKHIDKKYI